MLEGKILFIFALLWDSFELLVLGDITISSVISTADDELGFCNWASVNNNFYYMHLSIQIN